MTNARMKIGNKDMRNTIFSIALLVMTVGSLILLSIYIGRNGHLSSELKSSMLDLETMLSEKLRLERELLQSGTELQSVSGRTNNLQRKYDQAFEKAKETDEALLRVKRYQQSVAQLTKQIEELNRLKSETERETSLAKASAGRLQAENETLSQDINQLQAENQRLKNELATPRYNLDEVLATASSRRQKLTVKSKKVNEIMASMEVPAQTGTITFRIIAPDGSELPGTGKEMSVRTVKGNQRSSNAFYASAVHSAAGHNKEIELAYHPSKKLKPGVYKLEVFNDSLSIGSLQVKLR